MNIYSSSTRGEETAGATPLVLKLGGELLETPTERRNIAAAVRVAVERRPVVVVHGGGRSIDAELAIRQIVPKKVDGLRVTDASTLDVVVAVLAGSANTALVAALVADDVPAVGLTGVDAGFGRAERAGLHRGTDGCQTDLGLVGDPVEADPTLLRLLLDRGYVPVVASLGVSDTGTILNVNADVMACRVAAALSPCDLVIAGGTAGVLDVGGASIAFLDVAGIDDLIERRTATHGMVAKLSACRAALAGGVASVRIVDGRGLDATHGVDTAPGTAIATAPLEQPQH
jgi:acetylglutamate kinase